MGCEMKRCRAHANRSERIILLCQPLKFKTLIRLKRHFRGLAYNTCACNQKMKHCRVHAAAEVRTLTGKKLLWETK